MRLKRLGRACAAALMALTGCAGPDARVLPPGHPASPDAPETPVPKHAETLRTEASDLPLPMPPEMRNGQMKPMESE